MSMHEDFERGAAVDDFAYYESSTDGWARYIEGRLEARLAEERQYQSALLTEIIRDLLGDLEKTVTDVRLAAKPQDGRDGRGFEIKGTYNHHTRYRACSVVALNGGSFAARCDDPGLCPGEDWQLVAAQGKRGIKGDPGERGPAGRD